MQIWDLDRSQISNIISMSFDTIRHRSTRVRRPFKSPDKGVNLRVESRRTSIEQRRLASNIR